MIFCNITIELWILKKIISFQKQGQNFFQHNFHKYKNNQKFLYKYKNIQISTKFPKSKVYQILKVSITLRKKTFTGNEGFFSRREKFPKTFSRTIHFPRRRKKTFSRTIHQILHQDRYFFSKPGNKTGTESQTNIFKIFYQ